MTVSSETWRLEYAGNGVTTAFTTPQFLALADIKVYLVDDSDGSSVTWALTTDYTLDGAGSASGTVTAIVAPAANFTLVIVSDPAITQDVDYVENDPFPAASHEGALDKLTLIVRRLAGRITRSLQLADSDTSGASTTMPVPVALEVFRWNAAGTAVETFAPGDVELAVPADASVTLAKHASFTPYTLLGRASGTGQPSLLSFTAAGQTLAAAADDAAQRTALGLGSVATESLLPVSKGGTGLSVAMSHVSAKYDTTGQTVTSGAEHVVTFNTEIYDTLNEFASDTFTATHAGYYRVSAGVAFAADANWDAGDFAALSIVVGASDSRARGYSTIETSGVTITVGVYVARTIYLSAGNTVQIRLVQDSGSTQTLANIGTDVFVDIDRIH